MKTFQSIGKPRKFRYPQNKKSATKLKNKENEMKQAKHEIIVSSWCGDVAMMIDDEEVEDEAPMWLWEKVLGEDGYSYLECSLDNFVQMIAIGLNWKLGDTVKLIVCMHGKVFKFYYPVTKKKPREPINDEPQYFN